MKAIFRSGDPDPLGYQKSVEITTTVGQVKGVNVQGITITPQDARSLDLWYNPVTKRWGIGYNVAGKRVIVDLPESI
jgi:hypothetical protein